MWYFLVSGSTNKRKWPLAFVGLLLLCSIKLVLCQDNSDGATESNIEAQRREGNAQQSDNGKEIIMSSEKTWASNVGTVWSENFLYKVALPELRNSPIMYFVIHNSVVWSKILKIVVSFWLLFVYIHMSIIIKIIDFIESKIEFSKFCSYGTSIFNILDNTTELWMTKYIIGEFYSSGRVTLYKNPWSNCEQWF